MVSSEMLLSGYYQQLIVEGEYAWYYKEPEQFLVTDRAVFIQVSDNDSLLHADNNLNNCIRQFTFILQANESNHGCRIYSKGSVKCDSLLFIPDSVIRMYTAPVIWSEENQLIADSMAIYSKPADRQT
jgi:hypothetical protein